MVDASHEYSQVHVEQATLSDVPSLSTIVPRAFFHISTFHRQAWPDTPTVRAWWSRVFDNEINSPDCHVIAALNSEAAEPLRVVGFLTTRVLEADDRTAGLLSLHDLTEDHNIALLLPAKEAWVESRSSIFAGTGQKHFLLELLGVDHAHEGKGLGSRMLRMACEIADGAGHPIFVEANGTATGFYLKFGFKLVGPEVSLSANEIREQKLCRLVRPALRC